MAGNNTLTPTGNGSFRLTFLPKGRLGKHVGSDMGTRVEGKEGTQVLLESP